MSLEGLKVSQPDDHADGSPTNRIKINFINMRCLILCMPLTEQAASIFCGTRNIASTLQVPTLPYRRFSSRVF